MVKDYRRLVQSIMLIIVCLNGLYLSTVHAAQPQNTNAQNDQPPLVLGIFPRRNAADTFMSFSSIARYLSDQLGREVQLETARDFPEFWKRVTQQRYDIVHYNQYHYIKSHTEQNYQVILQNEEFGDKQIAGTILVRKDSEFNSLEDLKNKKIVFGGGKKAMIAYVVPTALLRRAGLKDGDYVEGFLKQPPKTVFAVYHKDMDAAGIGDTFVHIPAVTGRIDVSEIKPLATSESLAHLPWAVKGSIADSLRSKIQKVFLSLNDSEQGKAILKKAKLTGLHKANDRDYDAHRKILIEVFGDNY